MLCPSCHQQASSFFRNAFTLQGVSLTRSMCGLLRCQHCGALLRIAHYGRRFWYWYIPAIALLTLAVAGHRLIVRTLNVDIGVLWLVLLMLIFATFIYGVWRHAQCEMVEEEAPESSDV